MELDKKNLLNWLIDYHYSIEHEALKTEDVTNGVLEEALSEHLWEDYGIESSEADKLAKEIMNDLENELVIEIEARDKEAMEQDKEINDYYKEVQERRI